MSESTRAKLEELLRLRDEALHSGDEKAVERQRSRGKLLARERIEKLLDLVASSSSTATPATGTRTSGCWNVGRGAMPWSPATGRSSAAESSCSPRTSLVVLPANANEIPGEVDVAWAQPNRLGAA
jgi:hypothetical protein